jgi:hypothetical protein
MGAPIGIQDGFVVFNPTLDTVYRCLTGRVFKTEQSEGTIPTFEVNGSGSSINVYVSNNETEPADKSEMTLDTASPLVSDIYAFKGQVRWILFEQSAGTSVVKTINVVKVP